MLPSSQIEEWLAHARALKGDLPRYIPALLKVHPYEAGITWLAETEDPNGIAAYGCADHFVPLMSLMKPFLLQYVFDNFGAAAVTSLVRDEALHNSYQEIPQGKPANAMVNGGAIALCELLPSSEPIRQWLNCPIDQELLESVRQNQSRPNLAIAHALGKSKLSSDPDQALARYEELCCMVMTPRQLVQQSQLLRNQIVLETIRRHGMYRHFPSNIPCKSAVSGLLLAKIPLWGSIVTYCPPLDQWGHSVGGQFLLTKFLETTGIAPLLYSD
ncbi:MAG: hypothetical protein HC919_11760 [Oscillatoriales cyanobacterium SM2_2_1]|nr:hypothetical protein [Oscillatoriales cyanobacterium SM2_2_1]